MCTYVKTRIKYTIYLLTFLLSVSNLYSMPKNCFIGPKELVGKLMEASREEKIKKRVLLAEYDSEGVYVYQAFSNEIADYAINNQKFGTGFKFSRMTWVKPSFGWMLYRSGFAEKTGQKRVLKIKISHVGFVKILEEAVSAKFDSWVYDSKELWRSKLKKYSARFQWDPDRVLGKVINGNGAIQLGIKGDVLRRYNDEWLISIEDVTDLAKRVKSKDFSDSEIPDLRVYKLNNILLKRLGIEI